MIFCKPQSASAISIHFLHLSLPFSSPPTPPALSSDTLLTHPPPPPHTLHHFITIPSCRRSISLSARPVSLFHIFLLLYLTAPTFPCFPYRTISVHDLHHPLCCSLSLLNFPSRVIQKKRGKGVNRKDGWIDNMMDK